MYIISEILTRYNFRKIEPSDLRRFDVPTEQQYDIYNSWKGDSNMQATPLADTVLKALGPEAAKDFVSWLEMQLGW
jgi:hypothetical protein